MHHYFIIAVTISFSAYYYVEVGNKKEDYLVIKYNVTLTIA